MNVLPALSTRSAALTPAIRSLCRSLFVARRTVDLPCEKKPRELCAPQGFSSGRGHRHGHIRWHSLGAPSSPSQGRGSWSGIVPARMRAARSRSRWDRRDRYRALRAQGKSDVVLARQSGPTLSSMDGQYRGPVPLIAPRKHRRSMKVLPDDSVGLRCCMRDVAGPLRRRYPFA